MSYEWDTHTITFTDEFLSSRIFDEIENDGFLVGGSQILGVYYPDQFAFYLEGEELYRGFMKPQSFISFIPAGPMISDNDKEIEIRNEGNKKDIRNNEEL